MYSRIEVCSLAIIDFMISLISGSFIFSLNVSFFAIGGSLVSVVFCSFSEISGVSRMMSLFFLAYKFTSA